MKKRNNNRSNLEVFAKLNGPKPISSSGYAFVAVGSLALMAGLAFLFVAWQFTETKEIVVQNSIMGLALAVVGLALIIAGLRKQKPVVLSIGAIGGGVSLMLFVFAMGSAGDKEDQIARGPDSPNGNQTAAADGSSKAPDSPEQPTFGREVVSVDEPVKQIPYSNKPVTGDEYNEIAIEFHGIAIENYQASTRDSQARQIEVVQFMRDFLDAWYPTLDSVSPDWSELSERGTRLVGQPDRTTHLFLMATSGAAQLRASARRVSPAWRPAIKRQLAMEIGPRRINVSSLYFLTAASIQGTRFNAANFLSQQEELEEIKMWLARDFRALDHEHRVAFEMIRNYMDVVFRLSSRQAHRQPKDLLAFINETDSIPEWIREITNSSYLQSRGWQARSFDYAFAVSRERMNQFSEDHKLSETPARKAFEINKTFPESSVQMMNVAKHVGGDLSMMDWYDRSKAAQLDYARAHATVANYHQQKWGGSVSDYVDYGLECYQTGRFDTLVPYNYLMTLSRLLRDYSYRDEEMQTLLRDNQHYEAVRDCCEQYIKQAEKFPDSGRFESPEFYKSLRAMFSYRFGHRKEAVEELYELKEHLDPRASEFLSFGRSADHCRALWYVEESGKAEVIRELDNLWRSLSDDERVDQKDEILALIEKGMIDTLDPFEKQFWEYYKRRLDFLIQYHDDQWVNLTFEPGLHFWNGFNFPSVSVLDERSIRVSTGEAGTNAMLFSTPAVFAGPKTIEAEIEFSGESMTDVGIAASSMNSGFGLDSITALISPDKTRFSCGLLEPPKRYSEKGDELSSRDRVLGLNQKKPVRLRLNVCDGYVQVFANDRFVVEKYQPGIRVGGSVCIATWPTALQAVSFQISDLRVRKWNTGPLPKNVDFESTEDVDELLANLERGAREFPGSSWFYYRAAIACYNARRHPDACDYANKAIERGHAMSQVALFIAHEKERNGDISGALDAYQGVRDAAAELDVMTESGGEEIRNSPPTVANARCYWLHNTHPDANVRESELSLPVRAGSHPVSWVADRITASQLAGNGRFDDAARFMERFLDDVPNKFIEECQNQLNKYRAGEIYLRPADKLPFYHELDYELEPVRYEPLPSSARR